MKFRALCLLSLALFGCDKAPEQATNTQDTAQANTQPAANPTGGDLPTIVVATTGKGVPFTYKDELGTLVGLDLDIVRAIGELEGFRPEFVQAEWKVMFDEVNQGKYDVAVANISWTQERAGKYSLSDAYFFDPAAVVYKADSPVQPKNVTDLKSMKVGILAGSSYETLLKDAGATNLVAEKSGFEGFANFMRGNTDAYVNSLIRLKHTQGGYPDAKLVVQPLEGEDKPTASSVMVVNPSKPELLAKLNAGIAKLKASNAIDQIAQKHLAIVPKADKP